jgi:hypothetical protein
VSSLTGSSSHLVQGDQPAEGAEAHDRGSDQPPLERAGKSQRSRLRHLLRWFGFLTHVALRKPLIVWSWESLLTGLRADIPIFIELVLLWYPRSMCIIIFQFRFHLYLQSV